MVSPPPSVAESGSIRDYMERWLAWKRRFQADYSIRDFGEEVGARNKTELHAVLRKKRSCTVDMLWRWQPVLGLPEAHWDCLMQMARTEEAERALRRCRERCRKRRLRRATTLEAESAEIPADPLEILAVELLHKEQEELEQCRKKLRKTEPPPPPSMPPPLGPIALIRRGIHELFSAVKEAARVLSLPIPERAPPRACYGSTLATGPQTRAYLSRELRRIAQEFLKEEEDGAIAVEVQLLMFPLSHPCGTGQPDSAPAPTGPLAPIEPEIYDWGKPDDEGLLGYLRAWFAWKKAEDPSYSYEKFAEQTLQEDRSFLHKVLKGRERLTPARARQVAQGDGEKPGLELNHHDTTYFLTLLERDRRRGPGREEVQERLNAQRKDAAIRTLHGSRVGAVRDELPWILRELSRCAGFQADPAWMTTQLVHPREQDEVRIAWERVRADRLNQHDDIVLNDILPRVIYHNSVKSRAIQAFTPNDSSTMPPDGYSLRLRCSPARSRQLHDRIAAIFGRLCSHCVDATEPRDQVVQLNLHVWEDHQGSSS